MALIAHLTFWDPEGKPLSSVIDLKDEDDASLTASEVWAFEHCVWSDYHKKDWLNTFYDVRKHEPMKITKPLDRLSPILDKYCAYGTFLKKAEIRWYRFKEKSRQTEEYFRMTLEHISIKSAKLFMQNVKEKGFEKFDPYEEITFCYQKITWLYPQGYRFFSDQWNNFFEDYQLADLNKKETVNEEQPAPLRITFISGKFVKPDGGFGFDKMVTVKFVADITGKLTNTSQKKVYCKLYSKYMNSNAQDTGVIAEGSLRDDGSYSAEFKLSRNADYDKDDKKGSDAKVEYYVEIESKIAGGNFKSDSIIVPANTQIEWGVCIQPDNNPISDLYFEIRRSDEVLYKGKTGKNGQIISSFEQEDGMVIVFPIQSSQT